MESSTVDHSDSDSGESWTLLENHPTYGDDAPEFCANPAIPSERENIEVLNEKDDDTDGISVISDPDSTPCEVAHETCLPEDGHPTEETTPFLPRTSNYSNIDQQHNLNEETDYLGDNTKCKTYVHKRNPKVGNILDVIMLGTFVITAGMALGHLWSCKNECSTHTSVNNILTNLHKLQEENVYLRNKLKEITKTTGYQVSDRRIPMNIKQITKLHRCRKIFEDPILLNRKMEGAVKCVDEDHRLETILDSTELPEHEQEFLRDIHKIRSIYDQNKIWLDEEVKKQFDNYPMVNNNDISKSAANTDLSSHKKANLKKQLRSALKATNYKNSLINLGVPDIIMESKINKQFDPPFNTEAMGSDKTVSYTNDNEPVPVEMLPEKKITYADSLKVNQPIQQRQKIVSDGMPKTLNNDYVQKRKQKGDDIDLKLNSFSEEDINRDDRYIGPKMRHEKKKHNRHKSHKKQKRNNKYEQWEMKIGYLKDYDELSLTSLHDKDIFIHNPDKKFMSVDFENYINKLTDTDSNASSKEQSKNTKEFHDKTKQVGKGVIKNDKGKNKNKNSDWFDKRTSLRAEARMKMEKELFGDNMVSNNAAWYFRRMNKREQCRTQKDNSTFKKMPKRKMNFKMKR